MLLKRFFDLFLLMVLLPFVLPISLIISFFVLIFMGRPIFFIQRRVGLNNVIFNVFKFRTMKIITDSNGILLDNELRTTTFGDFLRRTSLDELPNLLCIFLGHMSFVGPRPLLVDYLPIYNSYHIKRHNVLPGLTGYAQVNGRNSLSWPEKFDLDLYYVENKCLFLDLKILFFTFYKVVFAKDTKVKTGTTMKRFTGYNTYENK